MTDSAPADEGEVEVEGEDDHVGGLALLIRYAAIGLLLVVVLVVLAVLLLGGEYLPFDYEGF